MVSVMCSERYSYQFLILDLFRRQFVGGGFANSVCSCVVGSRSYQGSVCRDLVVNVIRVRLFNLNWIKDVMRFCSSAGHTDDRQTDSLVLIGVLYYLFIYSIYAWEDLGGSICLGGPWGENRWALHIWKLW
jgi:hypothetical protein